MFNTVDGVGSNVFWWAHFVVCLWIGKLIVKLVLPDHATQYLYVFPENNKAYIGEQVIAHKDTVVERADMTFQLCVEEAVWYTDNSEH